MFYGWWIVILVFLGGAFGGATVWYGFTAFFSPLVKEFGWSYAAISFAASLRGAEIGLMDVVCGFLLDRFGCRRIILVGSIILSLGYFMLSRVNSLPAFYVAFLLVFIGGTGLSNVVFFSVVSRWFRKRLGLAIGLSSAGYGAGGFAVPVIVYLLDLVGLRATFAIFSMAALVIGGVIAYFLRDRPEDKGCRPDGVTVITAQQEPASVGLPAAGATVSERDYTFKEAVARLPFWVVTCASAVTLFSVGTLSTHVMPYLEHLGYERYTASLVAMMIPVMSIVGRMGVGWISDSISRRTTLVLAILGQVIGVALFFYARVSGLLIPFLLFFGVSYGGIVILRPVMMKEYYGAAAIGSLIGLCLGLSQLGSISGPLLAGWVFDTTGSYSVALTVVIVALLAALPLALMLKPVPSPGSKRA